MYHTSCSRSKQYRILHICNKIFSSICNDRWYPSCRMLPISVMFKHAKRIILISLEIILWDLILEPNQTRKLSFISISTLMIAYCMLLFDPIDYCKNIIDSSLIFSITCCVSKQTEAFPSSIRRYNLLL